MIALFIAGVLLLGALCGGYYGYRRAFYFSKKHTESKSSLPSQYFDHTKIEAMKPLIEELSALPYEEIFIKSYDGKKLFGRYYHVKDGAPVEIEFHGYKGNAYRDFCGGHKLARKLCHNIILVDQRSHGRSDGHTISFGVKERYDALAWANYAARRFNAPIFLVGVSMGAATVLMSAELDLPSQVSGIIADCPYSSPKEIIKKVCTDMGLPANALYPFVWLGAVSFGFFNPNASSAYESARSSKVPILVLHGNSDGFVPVEMAHKICDGNEKICMLHTFEGAGHGLSYVSDPERYEKTVFEFAYKCLSKGEK